MSRWLAPLAAGVSLLLLFVGLVRAETERATTAGVSMVFWGVTGLVLSAAAVGYAEYAARHRAPVRTADARRPPAARAR
jgi:hypothetical protein